MAFRHLIIPDDFLDYKIIGYVYYFALFIYYNSSSLPTLYIRYGRVLCDRSILLYTTLLKKMYVSQEET